MYFPEIHPPRRCLKLLYPGRLDLALLKFDLQIHPRYRFAKFIRITEHPARVMQDRHWKRKGVHTHLCAKRIEVGNPLLLLREA